MSPWLGRHVRHFRAAVLAVGSVFVLAGCSGKTTGTSAVTESSATLNATARCDTGETCTWYWAWWSASQGRSYSGGTSQVFGPVNGPTGDVHLSYDLTAINLDPGTTYYWVLCGSANGGGTYVCVGPKGEASPPCPVGVRPCPANSDPPADHETFSTVPVRTLAQRWNGTSWTIQNTPNPPVAESFFTGVSCPFGCVAVGYAVNGDRSFSTQTPLAEHWNGSTWHLDTVPVPSGFQDGQLNSVSCPSSATCVAVGWYLGANGRKTLVERWDGTSWTVQASANVANGDNYLDGVSCLSASACTAVGDVNIVGGTPALVLRWDGTSWTVQSTPSVSPVNNASLDSVSCTSATACMAVGAYADKNFNYVPLSESWNGTSWTQQNVPVPPSGDGGLDGVSCPQATACIAVGSADGLPYTLAASWNGTTWTLQNNLGQYDPLLGVSCTSSSACTAVGQHSDPQDYYGPVPPLVETWDGTSWTVRAAPDPPGSQGASFDAVSCTSSNACTAVGHY